MRLGPYLALACVAIASACSSDPTQLVVLVDSDLVAPADLTEARITIRLDEGGAVEAEQTFTLIGASQTAGPGQAQLPFSFGVAPAEQGFDQKLIIEVVGLGPQFDISRRAITRFIQGKSLLLPMFLARSCSEVDCGSPDQTCSESGCTEVEIDPAQLQSIAPGDEVSGIDIGMDAGTSDSGVGGIDAGPLDGAVDAGSSDAEIDAGVVVPPDAGIDAGLDDAGPPDAGFDDAGLPDVGLPDVGLPDAGLPDAGFDGGLPDAGFDGGPPDSGPNDGGVVQPPDGGLDAGGPPDLGAPDGGFDGGADAGDADASDGDVVGLDVTGGLPDI